MRLKPIGSNMTQIETDQHIVLFSYETPVAFQHKATGKYYRTSKKWSTTTSKHINKWLEGINATEVDQTECDRLPSL